MHALAQRWIDDAPDGIVIIDGEGFVRFANRASAALFRCGTNDLLGQPFGFPVAAGESAEIEIPQDDGSWGTAEMRVARSDWEAEGVHVAILRDVTYARRAGYAVRQQADLTGALVASLPMALIALAPDKTVSVWNPAAERLFGWRADEVLGRRCPVISAEDWPEFEEFFTEVASGRIIDDLETTRLTKSGQAVEVRAHAAALRRPDGSIGGMLCLMADNHERRQAEQRLQLSDKVFQNTQEGIVITDGSGHIISVNPAFTAVTGYQPEDVLGHNPSILQSGRHDAGFYAAMWTELARSGQWQGEIWNRRRNGEIYPEWLNISAVRDGGGRIVYYVAVFSDISLVKQNEERLHRLAHFDALTGLPNRLLFTDRLQHALVQARRSESLVGLLFIDLDRFKLVNDTLGHRNGDLLLQEAAHRLAGAVRAQDTVARLGGDEFTVILPDLTSPAGGANVAEKIIEAMAAPFRLQGRDVFIGASVGIAVYPMSGDEAETLIKHADIAMYRAKEAGRNTYQYYRPGHEEPSRDVFELEHGLRHALERGELSLVYQPEVAIETGQVVTVEALLRWHHPTRGNIPPAEFIPVAEDSGLIGAIGDWVLRQACAQNKAWQDSGLPPVRIAVNLSVRQLRNVRFAERVAEILDETGLAAEWLEVELTESMIMQYAKDTMGILWQLRSMGVRISIDDFGTGYSSLSYLKRLPVDSLKIDRSFVEGIDTDANDQAISNAIIALANSLNLRVVAEGVETEQQLWFLRDHACCDAQGYFFSQPVDAQKLSSFLRHRLN
ncbi:MAG: EAL domain-containing protein [Sterolibacteriaceae bacterium MAG5]|nr:EAL domain-containing protein [Candidatus Nitricoxidireducens bremensis]